MGEMARYEDWPVRLDQYIQSKMYTPFSWGKNDCAFFVSGALQAMSGINPTHWIDGKISNRLGALREAVKFGCDTIPEAEMKVLDEILTRQTHRTTPEYGDVVAAEVQNLDPLASGATIGMVDLSGTLMLIPGKNGLTATDITGKVITLWKW